MTEGSSRIEVDRKALYIRWFEAFERRLVILVWVRVSLLKTVRLRCSRTWLAGARMVVCGFLGWLRIERFMVLLKVVTRRSTVVREHFRIVVVLWKAFLLMIVCRVLRRWTLMLVT